MLELVDTHCHIQSIGLREGERTTRELWAKSGLDPDQVLKAATDHGVTRLVCVGCDLNDSQLAVRFVRDRTSCWASIGVHPHEAQHHLSPDAERALTDLATQPKVVAVGECGLDYYYAHSPKADQIKVLEFQLQLAQDKDLPVIFHVREAFDDFWPIFANFPDLRGVLHSFTDSADNLTRALDNGLYVGVNGIATFTKDEDQLEVYKSIPLERLLLETDAPFLTPKPYRGKINEPKQIGTIADFLSKLRSETREELSDQTTSNARLLFGI